VSVACIHGSVSSQFAADVAQRANLQEEGASTLVVGGFDDGDDVLGTHGPVELQAAPVLLGELTGTIDSLA
jgi:hypothetical protein